MELRPAWILLGLAGVAALAWYAARDPSADSGPAAERRDAAIRANAEAASDAGVLYRWRDAHGVLQITDTPPKGRKYERVERDAPPAIEVHGERE
ncbi:hypothetical protein LYSHEL_08550 [Lysobacter helvus]|uniref:DUF4124 domain-containing protein n=2 Tax=Lysobacteraceae TaxID=32033 RepID=A0ABN6FQX6_9GAMM|nr:MULTISPECIES: DUF4124 domain-containing protein [Lysobacter]BCT91831.1 hypothetical protein LYSCAS_08550 [Lysobacter caseinilyticus]BCT94984.1 hypothetical protein LYSHEL_08550 [Lysobacter helvus]